MLSRHNLLSLLVAWRLGDIRTVDRKLLHKATTKEFLQKRPALELGCWKVQTLMSGLMEDFQDISDAKKRAVINNELKRLNADITTLQETRLAGAGTLKEKDYTFYCQGKSSD